ncbi:MAG: response regulator [Paenibacillaceae bacterium]|jgi:DNA-binding response OmpR family regulator|nr:response regulator [Paenibacillaceae bacterium]
MKKILIADDEEILRMLICDSLEDLELEVDTAEDGAVALQLIAANRYDLIILDYMMPRLTGIDVLNQMDDAVKKSTAILMLTAKAQESDRQVAKEAGVHYFIPKPFSPLDLVAAVSEILSLSVGGER